MCQVRSITQQLDSPVPENLAEARRIIQFVENAMQTYKALRQNSDYDPVTAAAIAFEEDFKRYKIKLGNVECQPK